jgi:hypothetical protein
LHIRNFKDFAFK